MGDSFATGFGVENIDSPDTDCPGADWGGIWENFRKSWGAILGTTFDAEVHGIVYSGKGLIYNIWPRDDDPLRDYYPRADPNPEIATSNPPLFDLTSWIPDVIVHHAGLGRRRRGRVSRGLSRLRDQPAPGARSEHAHLHGHRQRGQSRGRSTDIAQSIVAERAAVGDDKMHAFLAKLFTWEEVTACNGHGTPAWHQRVAGELAAEIRAKVGWK